MSREVMGLQPNDIIIITGGSPFREVKHTNFMKIEELQEENYVQFRR